MIYEWTPRSSASFNARGCIASTGRQINLGGGRCAGRIKGPHVVLFAGHVPDDIASARKSSIAGSRNIVILSACWRGAFTHLVPRVQVCGIRKSRGTLTGRLTTYRSCNIGRHSVVVDCRYLSIRQRCCPKYQLIHGATKWTCLIGGGRI